MRTASQTYASAYHLPSSAVTDTRCLAFLSIALTLFNAHLLSEFYSEWNGTKLGAAGGARKFEFEMSEIEWYPLPEVEEDEELGLRRGRGG